MIAPHSARPSSLRWLGPVLLLSGACAIATLLLQREAYAEKAVTSQVETQTAQSRSLATARNAQDWGLDPAEWTRYQGLMRGLRGSLSAERISPIEVLGIHARSAEERRRYAEAWVQTLHEDTARVLAFERDVQDAWRRLYGGEHTLDLTRVPGRKDHYLQAGDRLALHTRVAQCAACDLLLVELIERVQANQLGLDIYFADGDDAALRAWATRHRIAAAWVQTRRITLNHDDTLLLRGKDAWRQLPYLYLRRGSKLEAVAYKDLRWPAASP